MKKLEREDLFGWLTAFYDKALQDPVLSPAFAGLNMTTHMPKIESFWAQILFDDNAYSGNPMEAHRPLPLTQAMFARWLELFEASLLPYSGENKERAWQRANGIALVMQVKLGVME